MKKQILLAAFVAIIAAPSYADVPDNVTLTIENDAGAVTTRPDMTRRECDAAVDLLVARKSNYVSLTVSGGTYLSNNGIPPPQPHTSVITSAKCMTPVDKKQ